MRKKKQRIVDHRLLIINLLVLTVLLLNVGVQIGWSNVDPPSMPAVNDPVEEGFAPSWGEGWLEPWAYRQRHTILYTMDEMDDGTGYQIRIKVHYGSGPQEVSENVYCHEHCNPDFSDIRFTMDDGVTELDHWLDDSSYVYGGSAYFWVELIDDVTWGTQQIYMYYGNTNAPSASDGDATFLFFDDFEGVDVNTPPDSSKWTVFGASGGSNKVWVINDPAGGSNRVMWCDESGDSVYTRARPKNDLTVTDATAVGIRWRAEYSRSSYFYFRGAAGPLASLYYYYPTNPDRLRWYDNTAYRDFSPVVSISSDVWYTSEFRFLDDDLRYRNLPSLSEYDGGTRGYSDLRWFYPYYPSRFGLGDTYVDNVYVRKTTNNEPPHGGWHGEELNPNSVPDQPGIGNVVTELYGLDVWLTFDASWGSVPIDEYHVEVFFDDDDDFTDDTPTTSWDTSGPSYFTILTAPYYDEFWYEIRAWSSNQAGDSPIRVNGPTLVDVWNVPTDDTYTDEHRYMENLNDDPPDMMFVRDKTFYQCRSWLKFDIPYPEQVKSATLYAKIASVYPNGHATVTASEVLDTTWTESTITDDTAPYEYGINLGEDSSGGIGEWDFWNVTQIARESSTISIVLVAEGSEDSGVKYFTHEFLDEVNDYRPHLKMQYYGKDEVLQFDDTPKDLFISDHFRRPELDPAWKHTKVSHDAEVVLRSNGFFGEDGRPFGYLVYCTEDNGIPQGTGWRGHYFEQDNLYLLGPFHFEMKGHWGLMALGHHAPEIEFGITLFGDGDYRIAEIYYHYPGWWTGNDAEIVGSICGASESYTSFYVQSRTPYYPSMFELDRDKAGLMTLRFHEEYIDEHPDGAGLNVATIKTAMAQQVVQKIEVRMIAQSPGHDSDGFGLNTDFVQLSKNIHLERPQNSVSEFVNPVREPDFNTGPIEKWHGENGIDDAIGERVLDEGTDYSWYVEPAPPVTNSWYMMQVLKEYDPDVSEFHYNSIRNQRVTFSFYAKDGPTDSRVRAMIRYQKASDSSWFSVIGEWVDLSRDLDDWEQVEVSTDFPLPLDVTIVEVWLHGESLDSSELFSCSIDDARFSIIELIVDDDYIVQINPGEAGVASFNLGVLEARVDSEGYYNIIVSPLVIVETYEGYIVNSISIDFDVNEGDASVRDSTTVYSNLNKNDETYNPENYNQAEWDTLVSKYNYGVKWGTRVSYQAFKWLLGKFASVSLPFFVGWIVADLVRAVGYKIYLEPLERQVTDGTTTDGTPGHVSYVYPSSEGIWLANGGLSIGWTIENPSSPPCLSVTFTVEYGSESGGGVLLTTRHTMDLIFNHLS